MVTLISIALLAMFLAKLASTMARSAMSKNVLSVPLLTHSVRLVPISVSLSARRIFTFLRLSFAVDVLYPVAAAWITRLSAYRAIPEDPPRSHQTTQFHQTFLFPMLEAIFSRTSVWKSAQLGMYPCPI